MRYVLVLVVCLLSLSFVSPSPPAYAVDAVTMQNAATATGNGVILNVEGYPTAIIEIAALTGAATVSIESSVTPPGVTALWSAQTCFLLDGTTSASSYTTTALFRCNTVGVKFLRARISTYGSGSVTVFGAATPLALGGGSGGGSGGSTITSLGVSTAAPPTLVEGANATFSFDPAGNVRMTMGTLLSGENQANNSIAVSGANVQQTLVAGPISTNATSASNTLLTGSKSIEGILVCNAGGSTNCGITYEIRGSAVNNPGTTTGVSLCTVTIPTGTATLSGACPGVITGNYSFYWIVTTGVAGTSPVLNVYAMY
jgi:hypothetical protein